MDVDLPAGLDVAPGEEPGGLIARARDGTAVILLMPSSPGPGALRLARLAATCLPDGWTAESRIDLGVGAALVREGAGRASGITIVALERSWPGASLVCGGPRVLEYATAILRSVAQESAPTAGWAD